MALAFPVFLVSILDRYLLVHDVLPIHVLNSSIGGLEIAERDEPIALGNANVIASDLWGVHQGSEPAECTIERLFADHRIQVTNEELGANLGRLLLVCRCLVDADRFSVQPDLVHDLCGILCVFLGHELDETEALVYLRDAILGKVHILDATGLEHELPDELVRYALIEVANVYGSFPVLLPGYSSEFVRSSLGSRE